MLNFLTSLYVCQSLRSCTGPHCQRPILKMHGINIVKAEYVFGRGQICQIIINNSAADQLLQLQWKSNTAKVRLTDKFGDALSLSLWRRVRFHSDILCRCSLRSVFTQPLIPKYFTLWDILMFTQYLPRYSHFYSNSHLLKRADSQ